MDAEEKHRGPKGIWDSAELKGPTPAGDIITRSLAS